MSSPRWYPPDSTLYIPIASPPTPAPSPGPTTTAYHHLHIDPACLSRQEFASLVPPNSALRRRYLSAILSDCTPSELLFVSTTIAPLLKRDFLRELPPEIALYTLSFIDDPKTLARASQVSKHWQAILADESLWKSLCDRFRFHVHAPDDIPARQPHIAQDDDDKQSSQAETYHEIPKDPTVERSFQDRKQQSCSEGWPSTPHPPSQSRIETSTAHHPETSINFSYRQHFKRSYITMMNWRCGGHLLRAHRLPSTQSNIAVITSVALDSDWVIVGLANCKIHVFSAKTGVLTRTLLGHDLGVWTVNLVSSGGFWAKPNASGPSAEPRPGKSRTTDADAGAGVSGHHEQDEDGDVSSEMAQLSTQDDTDAHGLNQSVPSSLRHTLGLTRPRVVRQDLGIGGEWGVGKPSDPAGASEGWGQPRALVISGGCDKILRVWDVKTGYCIYALPGHTSTIRCVKVLHNRPIAVTGSRDATLRVWDVRQGRLLRVLQGHQLSVRCLDVCGNRAVSGSYDATCRLWDVDTGQCLHIFSGHMHQIYAVAFDGVRIASGGLDTTVRIWDAATGSCTALLQGHTALVCQLQLSPETLTTGSSDGRVITFCMRTFCALHRIDAHESSVMSLQCDSRFLVTGGNDGRVRLFETETGKYVRELGERSESVWKVVHRGDVCVVTCKRAGKTVMEIWSFAAEIPDPV